MLLRSGQTFVLRMPLDVAVLPLMRARVRAFLMQDRLDEDFADDVVLCLQEACKNAIRFSHSEHGVLIRVTLEDLFVRVVVRDYVVGIDKGVLSLSPAPLAESGRGLHIMRSIMDDVEVRVVGGTELRMRKRMPLIGHGDVDEPVALSA